MSVNLNELTCGHGQIRNTYAVFLIFQGEGNIFILTARTKDTCAYSRQLYMKMSSTALLKCRLGCTCDIYIRCILHRKTWHSGELNEMSQKLLTFSWHLWSVAIWEPYDCWQIGMSAQACTTWPHRALCLSVYNRNIDTILTAAFLHKNSFLPFPVFILLFTGSNAYLFPQRFLFTECQEGLKKIV